MEGQRWFTTQQKREHDKRVGHQCEWVDADKRCPETTRLEANHKTPYGNGGETVEENLEWLCKVHHALFHYLLEQFKAVHLIESRMNRAELAIYWVLLEELGLTAQKGRGT